jgi:hypothetical protein
VGGFFAKNLSIHVRCVKLSGGLREQISICLGELARLPRPSRDTYLAAAAKLRAWQTAHGPSTLWSAAPCMATATLDDGWGHGLQIIQELAEAVGVRVHPLGICRSPDEVIDACMAHQPDLLGITVLQFDSEEAVRHIVTHLPPVTTLVAGGPAYRYDPDFAARTGTHFSAADGRDFLRFLLGFRPCRRR